MLRNVRPSLAAVNSRLQAFQSGLRLASTSVAKPSSVPRSTHNAVALSSPTPRKSPRFRRPKDAQDQRQSKRLLKPSTVSTIVNGMCAEQRLDAAIDYVQSLPLDAQNAPVWNTLIAHAGTAGRYRLAYQLYIDMKRRGIKPTGRTFGTLFSAFSKVDSWEKRPKLIQSMDSVYKSFLQFIDDVKAHNPGSPILSEALWSINAYLLALSKAGEYQRAFDVFNALDEDGPLSAEKVTYTIMFKTILHRVHRTPPDDENLQQVRERAASDARLIWRQLHKRIESGAKLSLDYQVVQSVLQCLVGGRPADHIVAFDIVRDYVGLAKPGETAPPAKVKLTPPLLQDILALYNATQKYRLTLHLVHNLMETNPDILDFSHLNEALSAYGSLSAMGSLTEPSRALQILEWMLEQSVVSHARLRPAHSSYTLVLIICWRAKDWESALRTFELMTGYSAADFADGAEGKPAMAPRADGRNIMPDVAPLSALVRTAIETGDPANVRQCLRIVRELGLADTFQKLDSGPRVDASRNARQKDRVYYAHKAARALVDAVDMLVPRKKEDSAPLEGEQWDWVRIRTLARSFLVEQRERRPTTTPRLEEHPLGSPEGLAATESAVEWDRIHREQKSAR
ncbi:hypothetical protein BD413DRAFT_469635 [Trametes elegans]|nr:hypothetical protein BD413DRAFT_469635 [Trametes elegans]